MQFKRSCSHKMNGMLFFFFNTSQMLEHAFKHWMVLPSTSLCVETAAKHQLYG